MASLKAVGGTNVGQIWDVKEPRCVLGRHPDCDVARRQLHRVGERRDLALVAGAAVADQPDRCVGKSGARIHQDLSAVMQAVPNGCARIVRPGAT